MEYLTMLSSGADPDVNYAILVGMAMLLGIICHQLTKKKKD